jgi:hypothetical protein
MPETATTLREALEGMHFRTLTFGREWSLDNGRRQWKHFRREAGRGSRAVRISVERSAALESTCVTQERDV